jgi:hypothetical protein
LFPPLETAKGFKGIEINIISLAREFGKTMAGFFSHPCVLKIGDKRSFVKDNAHKK